MVFDDQQSAGTEGQQNPAGDGSAAAAQGDDAQQQLSAALAELEKLRAVAGRAQADLQNAKVRMEKEAKDIRAFAAESMVRRLLPTLENFRRAFQHIPEDLVAHDWVKGVGAIEQELMRTMGDIGLKRMESVGQPVDPDRHEVLMTGPGPEGRVTEVLEEGYELSDRVLRPAKVKAGDGTEAASQAET